MTKKQKVHCAHSFVAADHPPQRRSLLIGRAMASGFSIGLSVVPRRPYPLEATIRGVDHPRMGLAKVCFSPHVTNSARAGRHKTRLLVTIVKEGSALISQNGRQCRLLPGDMAVVDPSRPFSAEADSIVAHSLYLPRSGVRRLMPAIAAITASAIGTASGPGAIFRVFLDELIERASTLDDNAIDLIADAIPSLLVAVLTSSGLVGSDDVVPPQHQRAHLHRIWSFVSDNLADPCLSPLMVAAAVNLSPRYLNQLVLTQGQTLMRTIVAKRLERCRAELIDPCLANRKISEIAFDWGFRNMPHFCRAFRQKFGYSATALRLGRSMRYATDAIIQPPSG